ncbi:hypothetical protein N9W82_00505 [Candidatus Pelagibacter bacterium]|nr:hypothetical protein [Candidatus Pelagibacter bacterium]|tara:strand:+ start:10710 stop:11162 length:453 start_codon:yes stop_codon:yes gene_type:complete
MSKKITPRQIGITLAVAVVIYLIFTNMSSGSTYSVEERMYAPLGDGPSPTASAVADTSASCEMKSGSGLASSLLPREVASQEEFGEFAPEDILAGQNFLEPRAQIGFPETVGGALRNANQQVRADPPNGKEPFVWNNSTISPDTMRRPLC